MAVKDVEMFVQEKRKNVALKKEWDKATKKEDKLKEDKKEEFFNKKLAPIAKKYGFDFSFDDFCEYKKHSAKPQNSDEELSDDELFNVAGGKWSDLTAEEQDEYNTLYKKRGGSPWPPTREMTRLAELGKKRWKGCSTWAFDKID